MEYIIIEDEKFFWNKNNLLEHKESGTTFNDRAEAEHWMEEQQEEYKNEM